MMRIRAMLVSGLAVIGVFSFVWPVCAAGEEPTTKPRILVETSLGTFTIELDAEVAPVTVVSFLEYVKDGFYAGTIFHRVTEDVIQGGGYTGDLAKKEDGLHDPIAHESRRGLYNQKYAVSLFRDPLKPKSGRTQFFVNVKDNSQLDSLRDGSGYAVFGKVVEGTDTIDKIAKSPVTTHPNYAAGRSKVVPVTPVVIKKMMQLDPLDREKAKRAAADHQRRKDDPLGFLLAEYQKKTKAAPKLTESGLTFLSLREGTGAFPVPSDTVELNFKGMLVDGHEFDSSVRRWNGPGKLEIATLLPGLREGLSMMQEGGEALLVLPPSLAFGEPGMPNRVPSNATVIFVVELLGTSSEGDNPD
jgi:cyclophilin family peptidyl-prolyl cis-trans isomerase